MRIFYFFIGCSLILVSGCNGAQKQFVPELTPVQISSPVVAEHITPLKQKKVYEFVEINGEHYGVPYPWRGKKIAQKSPDQSALKQIPTEFTKDQTKLYIKEEVREAFIAMAEAAREDNVHLLVHSAFRSVWYQRKIFSTLMAEGRTWEDLVRYVAPPGYSEHMLGVVVDLYPSNWRFASTPEYQWLKENASTYHFVESYPEINPEGFPWEAWHWKYISPDEGKNGPEEGDEISAETVADYVETEKKQ